jgi:hypothetical protein
MRRLLAAAAAGTRAGIRPSAGSVTMDVRSVFTTCVPNSKYSLSYVPTPPVPLSAFCLAAARSHSVASTGVKNALSFSFAGRCRGVAVAEFQMPPKSGSAPTVEDGDCARPRGTKDDVNRQIIVLSRLIVKGLVTGSRTSPLDSKYHAQCSEGCRKLSQLRGVKRIAPVSRAIRKLTDYQSPDPA